MNDESVSLGKESRRVGCPYCAPDETCGPCNEHKDLPIPLDIVNTPWHTDPMTTAPPAPQTTEKPRTARHFDEGTRVFHKEEGYGVICVHADGSKYPKFEKATGTSMTRVYAA